MSAFQFFTFYFLCQSFYLQPSLVYILPSIYLTFLYLSVTSFYFLLLHLSLLIFPWLSPTSSHLTFPVNHFTSIPPPFLSCIRPYSFSSHSSIYVFLHFFSCVSSHSSLPFTPPVICRPLVNHSPVLFCGYPPVLT